MKNGDDIKLKFNKYPIMAPQLLWVVGYMKNILREDVKHLEDTYIKELCVFVPTMLLTKTGLELKGIILETILGNMVGERGKANP